MRAMVSTWEIVVVIHVPMTGHVHVPSGTTASFEDCCVFGFLLYVRGHFARFDRFFDGVQSQFPQGAVAPIVAHATNFGGIRVMHLGVHKQVVPIERECDVQGQDDVETGTVVAVCYGHHDIPMKTNGFEVVLFFIVNQFVEHRIEIDAQFPAISGVFYEFGNTVVELPFPEFEGTPDFIAGHRFGFPPITSTPVWKLSGGIRSDGLL